MEAILHPALGVPQRRVQRGGQSQGLARRREGEKRQILITSHKRPGAFSWLCGGSGQGEGVRDLTRNSRIL